jgi:hypothetical protein
MQKKARGSSEQRVDTNGNVALVKWQDNKAVFLASNYVGIGVQKEVSRFD